MLLLSLQDTETQTEFRSGGKGYDELIKNTNRLFNEEDIPLELNHHTPTVDIKQPINFTILNPPPNANYPTEFRANTWKDLRDKVNSSECPIQIQLPDDMDNDTQINITNGK